jgi:protein-S-isoprenylcysteine O-methyltransferase Ste14
MNIFFLAISTLVYTGFLAVFTYLLIFIGGDFLGSYLPLPEWIKTINNGRTIWAIPGLPDGLNNFVLLVAFGLQHSLMARKGFKDATRKFIPEPLERSIYVLSTCIILVWWYLAWVPMGHLVWVLEDGMSLAAQILFIAGACIVLWSTFLISHWRLFGLAQAWHASLGKRVADDTFMEPALYKFSRHPMYVGIILVLWCTPYMTFGQFMAASVWTIYIFIGIGYEERDLLGYFGDTYRDYIQRVPQLLPFGRRK